MKAKASLSEEIVALGKRAASVMHELVMKCAEFDDSAEWSLAGFPTSAHWIAHSLDIDITTAREWVRVGKRLRTLPRLKDEFSNGRLSYSKVRKLTRYMTRANEAQLCDLAKSVPASELNTEIARWSMNNEPEDVIDQRQQRDRACRIRVDSDGSYVFTLRLPPLEGGKVMAAIDAEMMRAAANANHDGVSEANEVVHDSGNTSADASSETRPDSADKEEENPKPSLAQQRADAVVALVLSEEDGAKVETEVVVHVRGDGCSMDDGTPITDNAVASQLDSAFIRALIHNAERTPVNASGRQRHPTNRQKRVVKERDRRCVDCGSNDFLQFDHVPDFSITKHTVVNELELRCSRCHKMRHETEKRRSA